MRYVDPAIQALVATGRYAVRDAILFDFAEGQYGFWWGEGAFEWNGFVFQGGGQLFQVDETSYGDDEPAEITIKLAAIPGTDLTPDVLATIHDYTWHLRPVVIYRFYFDVETGALVGGIPDVVFDGIMNTMPHEDNPDGEYALVLQCVSGGYEDTEAGNLIRDTETQKLIAGKTDLFFEHCASAATQKAKWGPNA
ncbi:hypothetical protein [Roseibium sp. RKSG952]|uniref:hypothetical protein n=1 Tax=Roseibium sp. RKSG952 TaxID=2529384 RepID=UPI0012BC2E99|nr:hypothetical protein [Roseibium sp. RKSG952]MTH95181.1 hypothetical protein [Roseibium sp. RKSG952]